MFSKSIFVVLLAFCLLFSGCGKSAGLHVYEYSGFNDDTAILDYSGEVYEDAAVDSYVDSAAAPAKILELCDNEYSLSYYETTQKEFVPYAEDVYLSADETLKVNFHKITGELTGLQSANGIPLTEASVSLTESGFREIADAFMEKYIVIDDYEITCSTSISYFTVGEDGVASRWYDTKDYFYISDSETETAQYVFTYTHYLNGYKTSDAAELILNADGSLNSFTRINTNAFAAFEEVRVSENALENAVIEKLNSICTQGYEVESMTNSAVLCIDAQEQLFFVVSAKPTLRTANANAAVTEICIFIVTVE